MDDIEEGDQFANTSGNKLTVLMVKGIWVWVHYDSHILPSTVRKDSLFKFLIRSGERYGCKGPTK